MYLTYTPTPNILKKIFELIQIWSMWQLVLDHSMGSHFLSSNYLFLPLFLTKSAKCFLQKISAQLRQQFCSIAYANIDLLCFRLCTFDALTFHGCKFVVSKICKKNNLQKKRDMRELYICLYKYYFLIIVFFLISATYEILFSRSTV